LTVTSDSMIKLKKLIKKGLNEREIKDITRRSLKIVREYVKLYRQLNPGEEK